MRPFTTLARPFVAAPYIMTGLDAIRDPRERAERVGPAVKPVADRIDWMPKDPETLVRMEGALSLGTGVLLLTGKFRRLATLLLAAQLVPALAAEHHYWAEPDPERRANERSHLLKNAALFGALLMSATEPRRPPRTAQLRRAMRETQIKTGAEAKAMRREAAATLRDARREASRQVHAARAEAGRRAARRTAKAARITKPAKTARKGGRRAGRAGGALAGIGAGGAFRAGKAGGALKNIGYGGVFRAGKAGGVFKGGMFKNAKVTGGAFRLGRASKPNRAARVGRTVKVGTATRATKAMKAGRTVKTGTAVQAGKVLEAVKR